MIPPTSIDGTDITGATIDGTDVQEITVDGDVVFSAVPPIPDENIYLQDDFDDNRLTNRIDNGTTTYNGVTGTYRPEYTTETSFGSVSGGILRAFEGETVSTSLNLNLSNTITWEFFDVDISNMGFNFGDCVFTMYASQITQRGTSSNHRHTLDAFNLNISESGEIGLQYVDINENSTTFITASTNLSIFDLKVTRTSNGTWEIFVNNISVGTGTNNTSVTPNFFDITARDTDKSDIRLTEYKIS